MIRYDSIWRELIAFINSKFARGSTQAKRTSGHAAYAVTNDSDSLKVWGISPEARADLGYSPDAIYNNSPTFRGRSLSTHHPLSVR